MSSELLGFVVGALAIGLLALRVHIGIAMLVAGSLGYVLLSGWTPLLSTFKSLAYARFSSYDLSVVPLFLLMGNIASHGGLSQRLFHATSTFLGHYKGGLAMSAIGACAGFGAICGSSLATAATMGRVALPELRKHNYSSSLATGTLAAGGTLGVLIPPSVALVIYAILAEQNVAVMFIAAFVPGVIAVLGYLIAIALVVRLKPGSGPASVRQPWRVRWHALGQVWPILAVFVVVVGGIYGGVFTPTEAAAIGVLATLGVALILKELSLNGFITAVLGAMESTAMIFLLLIGADVLNSFLALSQISQLLAELALTSGWPPLAILAGMIITYVVLGCVMDSLSMILLTIPIFFPIIMGLDFWGLEYTDKAVWFGILALMVVEIGLITPPVGMNVFIINSLAKDIPMSETFKGVLPFLGSDLLRVVLLVFFPGLTLWLVHWLGY